MDVQFVDRFMEGQHASLLTGPMLFGYLLDTLFFGILSVQTYIYFLAFPKDARMLKYVVYGIYVVGLLQTISAMRDVYVLGCVSPNTGSAIYKTPGDYREFGLTWFNITLSTSLVAFVVQWMYAYRIYITSGNVVMVGFILCLSLLQLIIGIWGSATCIHLASTARYQWKEIMKTDVGYDANVLAWGLINAICGSLIAACMTYSLALVGALSDPRRSLLTRLIQLVIESGFLTTLTVIFYSAASIERNAPLYMLSGLPLGKIYSISMMVMLNNRLTIEGGRNIGDPSTFDVPVEFLSRQAQERRKKLGSPERGFEGRSKLERGMDGIVRRSVDSERTVAGIEVGATWSKEAWLRDEVEG